MVLGKANTHFDPKAKPKTQRIARPSGKPAPKTAPKMQKIPKGKPEPKKDAAKEKAAKAKADKRAKEARAALKPQQYSAALVHDLMKALRDVGAAKKLDEKLQKSVIGMFQDTAEKHVGKIINDLAGQGHHKVEVKVGPINFKGASAEFKMTSTQIKEAQAAAAKIGTTAVIVFCDPKAYLGGDMPEADKDQLSLHLPQPESDAYKPFDDEDDFDDE